MKLQVGDTIRVTPRDDTYRDEYGDDTCEWGVDKTLDCEWTGTMFLGCPRSTLIGTEGRWEWRRGYLKEVIGGRAGEPRCNIDCILEQLIADGSI
jgi:hypothetical protein